VALPSVSQAVALVEERAALLASEAKAMERKPKDTPGAAPVSQATATPDIRTSAIAKALPTAETSSIGHQSVADDVTNALAQSEPQDTTSSRLQTNSAAATANRGTAPDTASVAATATAAEAAAAAAAAAATPRVPVIIATADDERPICDAVEVKPVANAATVADRRAIKKAPRTSRSIATAGAQFVSDAAVSAHEKAANDKSKAFSSKNMATDDGISRTSKVPRRLRAASFDVKVETEDPSKVPRRLQATLPAEIGRTEVTPRAPVISSVASIGERAAKFEARVRRRSQQARLASDSGAKFAASTSPASNPVSDLTKLKRSDGSRTSACGDEVISANQTASKNVARAPCSGPSSACIGGISITDRTCVLRVPDTTWAATHGSGEEARARPAERIETKSSAGKRAISTVVSEAGAQTVTESEVCCAANLPRISSSSALSSEKHMTSTATHVQVSDAATQTVEDRDSRSMPGVPPESNSLLSEEESTDGHYARLRSGADASAQTAEESDITDSPSTSLASELVAARVQDSDGAAQTIEDREASGAMQCRMQVAARVQVSDGEVQTIDDREASGAMQCRMQVAARAQVSDGEVQTIEDREASGAMQCRMQVAARVQVSDGEVQTIDDREASGAMQCRMQVAARAQVSDGEVQTIEDREASGAMQCRMQVEDSVLHPDAGTERSTAIVQMSDAHAQTVKEASAETQTSRLPLSDPVPFARESVATPPAEVQVFHADAQTGEDAYVKKVLGGLHMADSLPSVEEPGLQSPGRLQVSDCAVGADCPLYALDDIEHDLEKEVTFPADCPTIVLDKVASDADAHQAQSTLDLDESRFDLNADMNKVNVHHLARQLTTASETTSSDCDDGSMEECVLDLVNHLPPSLTQQVGRALQQRESKSPTKSPQHREQTSCCISHFQQRHPRLEPAQQQQLQQQQRRRPLQQPQVPPLPLLPLLPQHQPCLPQSPQWQRQPERQQPSLDDMDFVNMYGATEPEEEHQIESIMTSSTARSMAADRQAPLIGKHLDEGVLLLPESVLVHSLETPRLDQDSSEQLDEDGYPSPDRVKDWLQDRRLGKYFPCFLNQGYDDLAILEEAGPQEISNLISLCGMPKGHARHLLRGLLHLREQTGFSPRCNLEAAFEGVLEQRELERVTCMTAAGYDSTFNDGDVPPLLVSCART